MRNRLYLLSFASFAAIAGAATAQVAANDDAASDVQEIVVTAQKRSERLQDVPLSINAATADQLRSSGITNSDQLQKIVPGFTAEKTAYGNPVFFIRGIGFNETTLGVSPSVSIYLDQQPLSFTPMARGAILDLERVEVLKGPQGTLFGENSTGGAINYIAAKPTQDLRAGVDLTYGRFGQADAEAFISSPISDTLSARFAVRSENRHEWQRGYANGDKIGSTRFLNGRLSLKWTPSDDVSLLLTANGWRDRSDVQQPQLIQYTPLLTGAAARPLPFPIESFPTAPRDPRAAGWDPDRSYRRDDWFYQFSGDLQADLSDAVHLASLTSYARYDQSVPVDADATIYPSFTTESQGRIKSFSQELRLNGEIGAGLKWMIGGNYKKDRVTERLVISPFQTSGAHIGPVNFDSDFVENDQDIKSRSLFGSLDYKISDQLTIQGSARYTKQSRSFAGCNRDTGDGTLASAISLLSTILTGMPQTIPTGACVTLDLNNAPTPIVTDDLKEDNVSYRVSLNWKPDRDTLVYANITKGYKAGSFPTSAGTTTQQLRPITQESVLAYEVGAKLSPVRKVQLSGAAFYYDYRDKQLLGYINDPVYGPLPSLVSIPKTHVKGGELSLAAGPFSGFTVTLNGTHILTRVDRNPLLPIGPYGNPASFIGNAFPLTPKWQGTADAVYRFDVSPDLKAFAGASVTGRTGTEASLLSHDPAVAAFERLLKVPGYALVDVRAGLEAADDRWRLEFWGRNIFNKFYNTGTTRISDFTIRFAGMAATYGVSLRYRL